MRLTSLLFGLILSLSAFSVMAGSNHDHGHSHSNTPVSKEQVQKNATEIVAELSNTDKLDKSWVSIEASSVDKVTVQGNQEWKVVFVNKNIIDADKQTLYMFLTLGGDYIAVNYTGK
jgi:hypothetical protein